MRFKKEGILISKETLKYIKKVRKKYGFKKKMGQICDKQVIIFLEKKKPTKIYPMSNIKDIIKNK